MSQVKLEPITNQGPPIVVPEGDNIIGRGPYLGVVDSRVSRNHAILRVENDGSASIKPVHKNPTFYKEFSRAENDIFAPLMRDEWKQLTHNDEICLLPNALIYRLVIGSSDSTLPVSDDDGTDIDDNLDVLSDKQGNTSNEYDKDSSSNNEKQHELALDQNEGPLYAEPLQKVRVLPDWLQQLNSSQPATTTVKGKGKGKGKGKNTVPKAKALQISTVTSESPTTSPDVKHSRKRNRTPPRESDVESDVDSPYKKRNVDETENFDTTDAVISDDDDVSLLTRNKPSETSTPLKQTRVVLQGNSEESLPHTGDDKEKNNKVESTPLLQQKGDGKEDIDEGVPKAATAGRKSCAYAATCYRRNPSHFKELSHPGDSDYEEEKPDKSNDDYDNDTRPECPYGPECYRKNKQHKLSYKHSKRPQREAARKARTKAGKSLLAGDSDDDGENDYDFDDSFIDDDFEESFEASDSDYEPSQDYSKETDDEADIGTLLNEANKFKKNKKMLKPS